MKNITLGGFEIYILKESLKHFKKLMAEENFPNSSFATNEYLEMTFARLEKKLTGGNTEETIRELNATA